MVEEVILVILFALNIIAFFVYLIDKIKAIRHKWRIPEKQLMIYMVLAPFGSLLSMLLFRHKIRKKKFMIPAILVCLMMMFGYNWYQVNVLNVHREKIVTSKIKGTLKIVQISDLHNHTFGKEHEGILGKVVKLEPDVIVITGDLIDVRTRSIENVLLLIRKLTDINKPIYYVSGNHENDSKYKDDLIGALGELEVKVINNSNDILEVRSNRYNICGVDDPHSHSDKIEEGIKGIDEKYYTILLAHAPDIAHEITEEPIDLILCGHTHAGQIRIPFIGAIASHGGHLIPTYFGTDPYVENSVYEVNYRTLMYIDSGAGTTTLNIRYNNRAQISLIEIVGN